MQAAEANVARLENIKQYRIVTAPFSGVITLRNLDSGALVNKGSTLLFRIAQSDKLRIYVNVPQSYADAVHKGDPTEITVSNLPHVRSMAQSRERLIRLTQRHARCLWKFMYRTRMAF